MRAALQAEDIGRALRDCMPDHMKKHFERADFAGGALVALDPLKARTSQPTVTAGGGSMASRSCCMPVVAGSVCSLAAEMHLSSM